MLWRPPFQTGSPPTVANLDSMRLMTDAILFWVDTPLLAKAFVVLLATILVACMYRYLRPLEALSWELRRFSRWDSWPSPTNPPTSGPLALAFEDFHSAWKSSEVALGEEPPRGMVAPEDYFSSPRLLSGVGRAIPIALPGVFAGIGILGTFLGIVLGLSGIDTGNANELMGSVQALLSGMSTAFVSSIVGISFSVAWLIAHRTLMGHVDAALEEACRGLARRFPTWDAQGVLRVSLVAQQAQLKSQLAFVEGQARELEVATEQKELLQNFGTDIAAALETALLDTIKPGLDSLEESFTSLSTEISNQQIDGMGELAKEFREQLMGSVNADFERLSKGLQEAAEVQEATVARLSEFMALLTAASEGQTELLTATALASERFAESIEGLSSVHAGIRESVPVLNGVAETAAALLADVSAQGEVLSDANRELREALATQVDEVQNQVDRLTDFGESFGGSLVDFKAELQDSIIEFRNVAAERLVEVFGQFDREMAKVVEHLSGTMAELREVSEELPSRVQGLRAAVEGLGGPVTRMADAFDSSHSRLEGYGEHLSRLNGFIGDAAPLEESLGRLEQRARDLTVAMDGLQSTLSSGERPSTNGGGVAGVSQLPDGAGA